MNVFFVLAAICNFFHYFIIFIIICFQFYVAVANNNIEILKFVTTTTWNHSKNDVNVDVAVDVAVDDDVVVDDAVAVAVVTSETRLCLFGNVMKENTPVYKV